MLERNIRRFNILLIISLLIILNIFFRFPITGHEIGADSFFIHSLAQQIANSGFANWLLNPLSFFGFSPYSYASGLPHFLAISSLLTSIGMEWNIYFVSLFFGIFGIFSSFALAGEFSENLYFRCVVAFLFSISPLLIKFTSWTVSGRGLFLVLLPLFLWVLLRGIRTRSFKFLALSAPFFITLASVHKMTYICIIFIVALVYAIYIPKKTQKISKIIFSYAFLAIYLLVFFIQFFFATTGWKEEYLTIFSGTEWYSLLLYWIYIICARIGPLLLFSAVGFLCILFKTDKSLSEWFLLFAVLLTTPFLTYSSYVYQSVLPIFCVLAGFGFFYTVRASGRIFPSIVKYKWVVIALFFVTLLVFSTFTIYVRLNNRTDSGYTNYMQDSTFFLAQFIQDETGNQHIDGDQTELGRVSAFVTNPLPLSYDLDYMISAGGGRERITLKLKPIPTSAIELFNFIKYPFSDVTIMRSEYPVIYWVENKFDATGKRNLSDKLIYSNLNTNVWYLEPV